MSSPSAGHSPFLHPAHRSIAGWFGVLLDSPKMSIAYHLYPPGCPRIRRAGVQGPPGEGIPRGLAHFPQPAPVRPVTPAACCGVSACGIECPMRQQPPPCGPSSQRCVMMCFHLAFTSPEQQLTALCVVLNLCSQPDPNRPLRRSPALRSDPRLPPRDGCGSSSLMTRTASPRRLSFFCSPPVTLCWPASRSYVGTKLKNKRGADLYQFWGSKITDLINQARPRVHNTILTQDAGSPEWLLAPHSPLPIYTCSHRAHGCPQDLAEMPADQRFVVNVASQVISGDCRRLRDDPPRQRLSRF